MHNGQFTVRNRFLGLSSSAAVDRSHPTCSTLAFLLLFPIQAAPCMAFICQASKLQDMIRHVRSRLYDCSKQLLLPALKAAPQLGNLQSS
jgi:hypothetical protein